MNEPTNTELMREVSRLISRVESLVKEVRNDYVRKDVYQEQRENARARLSALESNEASREKERKNFQRQVAGGALVGMILIITQIILTLAQTPGVGS